MAADFSSVRAKAQEMLV